MRHGEDTEKTRREGENKDKIQSDSFKSIYENLQHCLAHLKMVSLDCRRRLCGLGGSSKD